MEGWKERNRQPDHICVECGHRRDQHSSAREEDYMCQVCPPFPEPGHCFYDPMTPDEWRQVFDEAERRHGA